MPVVMHSGPEKPDQEEKKKVIDVDGSTPAENLLVRLGVGTMTGIVGFVMTIYFAGRMVGVRPYVIIGSFHLTYGPMLAVGTFVGFAIGFVLGDNISEDWLENLFGRRNNW